MTLVLGQIALLIGLTHAFRALVVRLGPRRSALLMGLPTSTAVMLVCCGLEQGVEETAGTSEACLLGMAAAAALPLIYAGMISRGWGLPWAPLASVIGFLATMGVLRLASNGGPLAALAVGLLGVGIACRIARRMLPTCGPPQREHTGGRIRLANRWMMLSRSTVPAVSYLAVRELRRVAGPSWSGQFITFPGASLGVLVSTHLEQGPGAVLRMALEMPAGAFGMIAFLSVFRFGCPWLGLGWGTALGYVAAIGTLAAVDGLGLRSARGASVRRKPGTSFARPRMMARRSIDRTREAAFRIDLLPHRGRPRTTVRRRHGKLRRPRFSPRIEMLAG
jgi:hypothetical protein